MSAETLRRAAALMRERAEAADYVRSRGAAWHIETAWCDLTDSSYAVKSAGGTLAHGSCEEEAEHIASWHPAVALAVADWLDGCATRRDATSDVRIEHDPEEQDWYLPAVAVANAYLQETP